MSTDFETLLTEAERTPTEGWDFTRLGDRLRETRPSWDYWAMVRALAAGASRMLDLGTGGGEQLARGCPNRPRLTVAAESWPPNVPAAARLLRPLGVAVVQTEGAPDNLTQALTQAPDEAGGRLPFRDGAFDLVIDRHEAFNAREVARALAPGGTFLTQQVGTDYRELHELAGMPWQPERPLTLAVLTRQVEAAGLHVEASDEDVLVQTFADAGVVGWYLRQVPWAIPDFDVRRDRDRLLAVHERILRSGPVSVRLPMHWLRAMKR
jgi:SAM-dependent methyltransferase